MNKAIIAVIIVIVVGAGGYLLLSKKADDSTNKANGGTSQPAAETTQDNANSGDSQPAAATITYSAGGYSPATITVKTGDKVVIKNTSSHDMQFDSDPHPAHTDNEELNVGVVGPGESMSFVVKRTGTFGYHNHLNPGDTGTIIVQ